MTTPRKSTTNEPLRLVPQGEYVRILRPLLPAEAFKPSRQKLWWLALHTVVAVAGIVAITAIHPWWARALLSLVVGHSIAGLAFFGHDLSHGSIVPGPRWRYPLELLVWSFRLMPVTVWRRCHNEAHHGHSNTPRDCDRQFLTSELVLPVTVLSRTFTPFGNPVRWNPLVGLAFIFYTIAHIAFAFIAGDHHGQASPLMVVFRRRQLPWVVLELVVIVALQAGIFALAGFDWQTYLWCGPLPIAVSSALTMMYIFTNHFLNPVTETMDPVLGSTSVAVPRLVDVMHAHFSYHTEHHLFPSLNSNYYPLVSRLLCEHFPDRYRRVPLLTAWRRLWSVPLGERITPGAPWRADDAAHASHGRGPIVESLTSATKLARQEG
jgi:fatty acid desaturase